MRLVHCFFFLGTIVAFVIACLSANPAIAQRNDGVRVALVVGMSKYKAEAQLPNAANDARLIAETLRKIGFDVDLVIDTGVSETRQRLRRFADKADGAAQAVLYFAGHGMQVNGTNHLLPVDALLERERDLQDETIDLDRIMAALANASARIVILDACRNNPLMRTMQPLVAGRGSLTPGLSQVQRVDAGSLIAFSTSPNTVAMDGNGANSPFTVALSKHLATPGLEIRQILSRVRADVLAATGGKQLPWDSSSLVVDVFLNAPSAPAASAIGKPDSSEAPRTQRSTEESDRLFWTSIKDSGDAEEFRIYLQQFPNGIFAALAKQRLTALQARAKPAPPAPPAPVPTPATTLPPLSTPPKPSAAATAPPAPDIRKAYDPDRLPFVPRPIPELLKGLKADTNWALALSRNGGWGLKSYADVADATRAALESCEFFAQEPCFLYAVRGQLVDGREKGSFSPQLQTALRQGGAKFDPVRVPFVDSPARQQIGLAATAAGMSTGHAALAISLRGQWGFRIDADSVTAQREALAICNKESTVPCFIFALDGKVVMREGGPDKQISAVVAPSRLPAPAPAAAPLSTPTPTTQAGAAPAPQSADARKPYDPDRLPFVPRPVPELLKGLKTDTNAWALAIARNGGWGLKTYADVADSTRAALEICEFYSLEPCFPYAVKGQLVDGSEKPSYSPQPQSTLRQTGAKFDPARIPFVDSPTRAQIALSATAAGMSTGHAALAISPRSQWGFRIDADSATAQREALAICNKEASGTCFIFALDGKVVMRDGGPNKQISSQPPPPGAKPPIVAGATLSERRYDAAQIPFIKKPADLYFVDFANRPMQWAIAVAPGGGHFEHWGGGSTDIVRRTLEGCEFHHQQACVLHAVSGWVVERAANAGAPQSQASLRQTSQRLDASTIPFLTIASQERVKSWLARLPSGHRSVLAVSAAGHWLADNAERPDRLQQRVLVQCNQSNPVKHLPCFIYAVDGTVVMRAGGIGAQVTK